MAARAWSIIEAIRSGISGRLIGNVEGVRGERLSGWLFDRFDPRRRLTISITTIACGSLHVLADRYRADVHRSGQGDGYCGFSVPLATLGDMRGIRLFCMSPRVELKLPRHVVPSARPARQDSIRRGTYRLDIDRTSSGIVSGWALDEAEPERRRLISLRHHGRLVTQQRATLYRPVAATHGDGFHGFSLVVPHRGSTGLVVEDAASGISVPVVI